MVTESELVTFRSTIKNWIKEEGLKPASSAATKPLYLESDVIEMMAKEMPAKD